MHVKEEWDCNGKKSREVGTHLHKQIENCFLGIDVEKDFVFNYNGVYIKETTLIAIDKEIKYLKDFVTDNKVVPYRTEWRIFDKKNMIAGTIDFICKNGTSYDIYDWKRSDMVFKDNPFERGYGELGHLKNTSFNRYSLQQNLYKYILEKNYGINVGKMYLVVLHPNYDKYKIVSVPELKVEIDYILNNLNLYY